MRVTLCHLLFFFNDTATTEIYTLSLHDALPIFALDQGKLALVIREPLGAVAIEELELGLECHAGSFPPVDRKSTRLNSSHVEISYAVFCLKKKKESIYGLTHQPHTLQPLLSTAN